MAVEVMAGSAKTLTLGKLESTRGRRLAGVAAVVRHTLAGPGLPLRKSSKLKWFPGVKDVKSG